MSHACYAVFIPAATRTPRAAIASPSRLLLLDVGAVPRSGSGEPCCCERTFSSLRRVAVPGTRVRRVYLRQKPVVFHRPRAGRRVPSRQSSDSSCSPALADCLSP